MKNQVQLITYVDRLGGGNITDLRALLDSRFKGLFGGVHLLPFYYPIDGEDAGFDPIDHAQVDGRLGDWPDVAELAREYDVMADMIVNHVSADSAAYQDYFEKGEASEYASLFLRMGDVFPDGVTEEELLAIYRPRPGVPFTRLNFKNGGSRFVWTTFTHKQIDINVFSDKGQAHLDRVLGTLHEGGVKLLRLDAAGYAVKTPGTSCFMTPETFDFIADFTAKAHKLGQTVLVEIHSYYKTQIDIARRADWVYDFALPPLVLQALFAQTSRALKEWLAQSPRNCITVLDTHDGIGIVDVAPHGEGQPGLLDQGEIDHLVDEIHRRSLDNSRKATGAAARNVDLYQVNCTFYDALGGDDQDYLLARLIQFFAPGIPQVYYVGALAGHNDMELLMRTQVGRDINRHYYTPEEIDQELQRPVVQNLCALMRFRNTHPAFDGDFELLESGDSELKVSWQKGENRLLLSIDLEAKEFTLESSLNENAQVLNNWSDFAHA